MLRLTGAAVLLSLSACAPRTVVVDRPADADPTVQTAEAPVRPSRTTRRTTRPATPAAEPSASPEASRTRRAAGATLVMPVEGASRERLRDTYNANRSGGRLHRAIDIAAPRGTPVLAAGSGTIRQMRESELGGITMVIVATDGRMVHYYAHLDRYVDGLREGDRVRAGQHIAYVGTTGNAQGAHLHFATWRIADAARYWQGEVVNPYPMLRGTADEPMLAGARPPAAATVTRSSRSAASTSRTTPPRAEAPRPTVDEQVRAASRNERPANTRSATRPAEAPAARPAPRPAEDKPAPPRRRVGW